jgi:hypothetical protein
MVRVEIAASDPAQVNAPKFDTRQHTRCRSFLVHLPREQSVEWVEDSGNAISGAEVY